MGLGKETQMTSSVDTQSGLSIAEYECGSAVTVPAGRLPEGLNSLGDQKPATGGRVADATKGGG